MGRVGREEVGERPCAAGDHRCLRAAAFTFVSNIGEMTGSFSCWNGFRRTYDGG
jgi:hypothetical protein